VHAEIRSFVHHEAQCSNEKTVLMRVSGPPKPVRRKIALKIIKAGIATRNVIAQFQAERQAPTLMDHPNIVKDNTDRPF